MRVVVKIGSNIVAGQKHGLDEKRIRRIAGEIAAVREESGVEVVIVSSGAIAAGMDKLGLKRKPRDIMHKQAAAAVGQSLLMWAYESAFSDQGIKTAQVLLTRDDLSDRKRYINSRNTVFALLSYGVIPVINENDTVATDEIMFGDNDELAALIAVFIGADTLIILSDVDGLHTADPRKSPKAKLIRTVKKITKEMERTAETNGSAVGTGGMYSKLLCAKKALRFGVSVNIINGKRAGLLKAALMGTPKGTVFVPEKECLSARKGWIAYGVRAKGKITIDDGAVNALIRRGKSLLPSGIVSTEGSFEIGDAVKCMDGKGRTVAKGLTNYSSGDIRRIKGKKTSEIEKTLGYKYSDEVLHRDNMVVLLTRTCT